MDDEAEGQFGDPAPRPVAITWVWPGRWLLTVGGDVAVVITGAEVAQLVDEVNREAGRHGV